MKKLFIVSLLTVASMSSYAFEAKVICGGKGGNAPQDNVKELNKKIKEAIKAGFTDVSAPAIAAGNEVTYGDACVTVSKR